MTIRTFTVGLLSLFFGLVYPAYGSIAAIESSTGEDDTHWLIYWLIFSLITILENVAWPVLQWIPLYYELKVAILAWLVLPQTKGALWVYEDLLAPGLQRARRELANFPAVQKALARFETPVANGNSAPDAETALAERRAKMGSVLSEVNNTLEGDLRNISGISDAKTRAQAENAFDKDLNRLSKAVASRKAGSNKFLQSTKVA